MKYLGLLLVFMMSVTEFGFSQIKPLNTPSNLPLSKGDSAVQAQNKLYLLQSEYATGFQDKDLMYVIKPIFRQGSATLTCDSANYYPSRSYFEAFGGVHINHADTTNVFSDKLEYDGKTKQAYLTENVQLVNPSSTLSTEILLYNLGTKIGTYTHGGTLENKSVTINSKNGYYFGSTQDVYFRYNVVAKTKQTTIKSDTLRFNSNTNTAFFYGPTNIYGKDDQMYTENGTYNTKLEQAFFGKNNLYNQGSKYLKGDSLFYDGKAGYGKAIRNIKFLDTVQRIEMYGQQGYYYKENKYTLVTDKAFLVMETKDTLKNAEGKVQLDSIWMTADTLGTQMIPKENVQVVSRIKVQSDDEIEEETPDNGASENSLPGSPNPFSEENHLNSAAKIQKPRKKSNAKLSSDGDLKLLNDSTKNDSSLPQKVPDVHLDSSLLANTVQLKDTLQKDSLVQDTIKKLTDSLVNQLADTSIKDTSEVAKLGIKLNIPNNLRLSKNKNIDYGTVKRGGSIDSVGNFKPKNEQKELADSLQARIITAFHNVKIYKHDIQTKADSIYYNSIDSTIRCFIDPIIWSNRAQLTADTIFIQLRDKKLQAIHAFKNTYLSQVEERDTLKFNQAKGRQMIGVFDNGKISNFYIDGNAESMYFVKKDSLTFTGLNQTVSGRIKIDFKDGKMFKVTPVSNVDGKMYPMFQLPDALEMKGFSWKPKERPSSKKDIIPENLPVKAIRKIKTKGAIKAIKHQKG